MSTLLKWMNFAFMPVELEWADERREKTDLEAITLSPIEDETAFSFNKSFNELHYLASKAPVFSSISHFFDQVYSPFKKPSSTGSFPKDSKWFSSAKLYKSWFPFRELCLAKNMYENEWRERVDLVYKQKESLHYSFLWSILLSLSYFLTRLFDHTRVLFSFSFQRWYALCQSDSLVEPTVNSF